jgi:hypothetical protein
MSFEKSSIDGEMRLLQSAKAEFDRAGRRYSGFFDGSHVIFRADASKFTGRWIQGSDRTEIPGGGRLASAFAFTFMDHGPRPQRLHAIWNFDGPVDQAIAGWEAAGFSVSRKDQRWNRNHPSAIHLRTRGEFATGADSSHVVLPLGQSGTMTHGDIHVGEFNPLTGFGVGFALHQMESWMSKMNGRR